MAVAAAFSYTQQDPNAAALYDFVTITVGQTVAANKAYRATTGAYTVTLPAAMTKGQWVVIGRDQTSGTTTVGANGQTIDAVAADFTIDVNKPIVLFLCTGAGTIVTRAIGQLP